MSALVETHPEDRVAGIEHSEEGGQVRLRPRVGLDVGVFGAEQRLGPLDRKALDGVDHLASLVVTTPRIDFLPDEVGKYGVGLCQRRHIGQRVPLVVRSVRVVVGLSPRTPFSVLRTIDDPVGDYQ